MDHFMEEVVVKKNKGMNEVLFALANVLMIVNAIIGMMSITPLLTAFSIPGLIISLVSIGSAVLMYLFKDRLRTEYEYTFTNGDLDFAEVYNNKKRKSLGTMRVKNVEAFGPVDSNEFRKLINMQGLNKKNWFLNRGSNLYYFYYQKENNRTMIILEPSDELVEMIRKYLPHGAYRA